MLPRPAVLPTLLFEHPLGRITHEPGELVRLQWLAGARESAGVQAVFKQLLRAYQRTACPKLLIDERLASPFTQAAKRWLSEEWLLRLVQPPHYQRVALVTAANVYARLSTVRVLAEARRLGLPHHAFAAETDAQAWLRRG